MKDKIIYLLSQVSRHGINNLIAWLDQDTDFFSAPASTKYHDSHRGGLVAHSFNVYNFLNDLIKTNTFNRYNFSNDTIIISSILHDVCKTNFYKESTKNVKNDLTGQWEKQPYYMVEDTHLYGHGECSVMLIEKFILLSNDEKYAIRWHMGGFDSSVKGGFFSFGNAISKYPLILALHTADMMATYII